MSAPNVDSSDDDLQGRGGDEPNYGRERSPRRRGAADRDDDEASQRVVGPPRAEPAVPKFPAMGPMAPPVQAPPVQAPPVQAPPAQAAAPPVQAQAPPPARVPNTPVPHAIDAYRADTTLPEHIPYENLSQETISKMAMAATLCEHYPEPLFSFSVASVVGGFRLRMFQRDGGNAGLLFVAHFVHYGVSVVIEMPPTPRPFAFLGWQGPQPACLSR